MSDPTIYVWDAVSKRYRNTVNGRYVSERSLVGLRDEFIESQIRIVDNLSQSLIDGNLTVQAWETEMTNRLRKSYTAEFLAGRGGKNAISQADYDTIEAMVRNQQGYLRGFAEDIATKNLSEAQITARARLYAESSRQAFERGKAATYGFVPPAVPGDGSTLCKTRCRCWTTIKDKPDRWEFTWHVQGSAESCATCLDRGSRWNPYVDLKE